MNKQMAINVTGRVQGVNFRVYASSKAESLGLVGFVQNEKDGSVTIVAEGPKNKLNEFVEWAKTGPQMAYVKMLRFREKNATGEFDKFEIRYLG